MRHLPSTPRALFTSLRTYALVALGGSALLPHAAAQTEVFGEWEGANSVELFVALPPLGVPGNPGTLAAPVPSITAALALAAANGDLDVNPVTINVTGNGLHDQMSGEVFPITLPAYGVSIEAHYLGGGIRPQVSAGGIGATEIFLYDEVGNPDLPVSVLRGLTIFNSFNVAGSADVRIAIPAVEEDVRIAPEIRDCIMTGEPNFGVQIFSTPGAAMDPVLERNLITGIDPFFGIAGVDIVSDEDGGTMSALIRSNEITRYQSNLRITGGGLSNQCRVESNFISVGETNVELAGCAPYIMNNTIAFAFSNAAPVATGISWVGMPALGLSNNLIWNPDQGAVMGVDIAGPLAVFAASGGDLRREAFFNVDEDNTLFAATVGGTLGVVTIYDTVTQGGPLFVGLDFGNGVGATDMHLTPLSPMIDFGLTDPWVTTLATGVSSINVPGPLGARDVRMDTVYDGDFDARLAGTSVDVGADEFIGIRDGLPQASLTRDAMLMPTIGSTFGIDMDELGNMIPDDGGLWNTQVDIVGTPGDFAFLFAGFTFDDFATTAAAVTVENRFLMQNTIIAGLIPGVVTICNMGLQLGAGFQQFNSGPIPANGILRTNLTFGAAQLGLTEGEVQLQALVLGPATAGGIGAQMTNRLTLEVNQ